MKLKSQAWHKGSGLRTSVISSPKQVIPKRQPQHNGQENPSITWHDGQHEEVAKSRVDSKKQGGNQPGWTDSSSTTKFGEKWGGNGGGDWRQRLWSGGGGPPCTGRRQRRESKLVRWGCNSPMSWSSTSAPRGSPSSPSKWSCASSSLFCYPTHTHTHTHGYIKSWVLVGWVGRMC